MNIVWKRPDGGISVTHLAGSKELPEEHAQLLKMRGDVPATWIVAGCNMDLPNDRKYREAWVLNAPLAKVEVDAVKAALIDKKVGAP